jgi:hypothetical protein
MTLSTTNRTRPLRLAAAAALALGLLAGCGGDDGQSGAAPPPVAAAAVTPEPEPTEEPVPTPASTAGPLSERQLPAGKSLGAKWTPYAQPGGGESGVIGNGAATQERDVDDVLAGLAPIGCPEKAADIALPRPKHALEGSYRGPGAAPGVGLVLEFGSGDGARRFLDRLSAQVDACPTPDPVPARDAPQQLGFERLAMAEGRLAALRRAYGIEADPHRYLLVATTSGARVALVYLAGAEPADRDRIAKALMASAAR